MDNIAKQAVLGSIIFSSESEVEESSFKNPRKKRKIWVREAYQDRGSSGQYVKLVKKLAGTDPILFRKYMRMGTDQFEELLQIVGPDITKEVYIREPIAAKERLAMTIRFLASGDMQASVAFNFLCSPSTVHKIIKETTEAIWDNLKDKVFPALTAEFYETVADGFERKWNFPNCIGAIDGKHVTMQAPARSGSTFFNYKKTHSIVLMAACDFDYSFIMCDIGAAGRQSDGGIFRNSQFGKKLLSGNMDFPRPRNLSEKHHNIPHVFLVDDAFPLTNNMMKPFNGLNLTAAERIFNYRLCRGRRLIENTFGILATVWRVFRKPICAKVTTVEKIIGACVCLHNWLRAKKDENFLSPGLVDTENVDGSISPGSWRNHETNFTPFRPGMYNPSTTAKEIRCKFADYFTTDGAVEWQWDKL